MSYPSLRRGVQGVTALLYNIRLPNLLTGTIHQGPTKYLCVPGLNCYSCPAALASCPLGALQTVLSNYRTYVSAYAVGFLALFGSLFGRFTCGWLCPFGLYQELLHRLPGKKMRVHVPKLAHLRYFILASLVLIAPLALLDPAGNGIPAFCAWLCPAGTLQVGLPLLASQPFLREIAGALLGWKAALLIALSALSVSVYRPFCRWICPLGLIYGWFNGIALHRISVSRHACTSCRACEGVCGMDAAVWKHAGDSRCIRCGDCVRACPSGALTMGFCSKEVTQGPR